MRIADPTLLPILAPILSERETQESSRSLPRPSVANSFVKEVFCDKRMFNIVSTVSNVKNASGMFSENEIVTKKQKTEAENITNKFNLAPS